MSGDSYRLRHQNARFEKLTKAVTRAANRYPDDKSAERRQVLRTHFGQHQCDGFLAELLREDLQVVSS